MKRWLLRGALAVAVCVLTACAAEEPQGPWVPGPAQMSEKDHRTLIDYDVTLASGLYQAKNYRDAVRKAEKALKQAKAHGYLMGQAGAIQVLAFVYLAKKRPDAAARAFQHAAQLCEDSFGVDARECVYAYSWCARSGTEAGLHPAALACYLKAHEGSLELYGDASAEAIASYETLTQKNMAVGNWGAALDASQRALAIVESRGHVDEAAQARLYAEMGRSLGWLQRYDEAVKLDTLHLRAVRKINGPRHMAVGLAYMARGLVYRSQGKATEAISDFEQALSILEERLGEQHAYTQGAMKGLATAHQAAGHWQQAGQLLERLWALQLGALGADNPLTQQTRELLEKNRAEGASSPKAPKPAASKGGDGAAR